jgi:PiT family inorganic phosphate transporter
MVALIFLLLVGLAAANGSNDVSKGVATLAGAGVTRYRTAVLWGAVTTLAGSLFSLSLAGKMTKLFSKGIVSAQPTRAFTLAVLVGAAAWVTFASTFKLPVSTTHAIVGALLGAGLLLAPGAVNWGSLPQRVVLPLLLSIAAAYLISLLLNLVPERTPRCTCARPWAGAAGTRSHETQAPEGYGYGLALAMAVPAPDPQMALPGQPGAAVAAVPTMTAVDVACPVHGTVESIGSRIMTAAHWLSSGAASFSRGLNDTPKIVAIGAFALIPAGMTSTQILLVGSVSMALGSLLGLRVARRLGEGVVKMSHTEGLKANLTTAALVGLGAARGLPMSTTHVSTGAIVGTAGSRLSRLSGSTLRDFAIAWTVTPLFAAAVAALVYLAAR